MKRINSIAIIGAGLMGGSLAKALRKKNPELNLRAYARSRQSLKRLGEADVFSVVSTDLEAIVSGAEIIFLAVPVEAIIESFKRIRPFLKKGAIVSDLGSSKVEICRAAGRILPEGVSFVGAHPLTGSEKSGITWSRYDLYENSLCVITADKKDAAAKVISRIWRNLGARVIFMDSGAHDKMLSSISHLPHLLSFSLTEMIPLKYAQCAMASLKDLTRISGSPAAVWADIFISNRNNIIKDIKSFVKSLKKFEALIQREDKKGIIKAIKGVNQKKKALP